MQKFKTYEDLNLEPKDKLYQVTVLGSSGCGKTSLINKFVYGEKYEDDHTKDSISNKKMNKTTIKVYKEGDKNVYLRIFDPSGHKDFTRLRDLTVPVSEYIIIMYAVDDREGFYEAQHVLVDVVKRKGKENVKTVICCTKIDKTTNGMDTVSVEEGKSLGSDLKILGFGGCSAVKNLNVNDVFDLIINDILGKDGPKKTQSCFCC